MYRISFIDSHGHIRSATDIRCGSDDEAIERAAGSSHAHELEIWQGDRLVWRFGPSAVRGGEQFRHRNA